MVSGTYSSSAGGMTLQTILDMLEKYTKKHAVRRSMAQHGTASHRTAGHGQGTGRARAGHGRVRQGTAPRGAARRCAAGLALRCALMSGAELTMMRQMRQAKWAVHCALCLLAMSHSDRQSG